MNFNSSQKPEYDLFRSTTNEFINLYGLECKYIKTDKINKDFTFGEYSHLAIDSQNIFSISLKLSNDESWDGGNVFSKFGLSNLDTSDAFVSAITMETIHPNITNLIGSGWDEIIGNLVVFPSGKIMEITNFNHEVQGSNNLFPFSDKKNIYKLTLKQYIANRDDIPQEVEVEIPSFTNLEDIFGVGGSDDIRRTQQETSQENKKVDVANVFGDLG
jgi:hypothetical protein